MNLAFFTSTPGPRIMRIHLVRYSTSGMFEKNPQIYTYCEFIQLVQIKDIVYLVKNREIRTK